MKKAGQAAMELRGQLRSQMEFGIEGKIWLPCFPVL
jgi:hypothetical protein